VEHRFGQRAGFPLGIEEELLLIDAETFRPANIASELIASIDPPAGLITNDVYEALIECSTPVVQSAPEGVETLTALREALETGVGAVRCAAIHGGIPAAAREAERLRFQRGEARVVLFTVEEGISLHQGEHDDAVRSEVIHDLRWSAIQMAQIEGRCHRDGRFAQVYWAYADETIEERIAQVVARRIQSMKEMVGDDVETLREIERLLDGA